MVISRVVNATGAHNIDGELHQAIHCIKLAVANSGLSTRLTNESRHIKCFVGYQPVSASRFIIFSHHNAGMKDAGSRLQLQEELGFWKLVKRPLGPFPAGSSSASSRVDGPSSATCARD